MALVKRQHIDRVVALGEDDDRRVRQADPERSMTFDDLVRLTDIDRGHGRQRVRAAGDLCQQAGSSVIPDSRRE